MKEAIIIWKRRSQALPSAGSLKLAGFHVSSAVKTATTDTEPHEKAPCRGKTAEGRDASD